MNNTKKRWLIELSEMNINLFIPLIFPVFKRIEDYTKAAYINKKLDNQLFKTFRYFCSYIFAFIPLIIVNLRTGKEQKVTPLIEVQTDERERELSRGQSMTNEIQQLKNKNRRKKTIQSLLFLFGLCLLGIFCYWYRKLFEKDEFAYSKQSIGIFFEIFVYALLSFFILKQKLYRHHFVSAGFIGFFLLIIFIITFFYSEASDHLLSIVYYFFFSFCFGSYDILGKKYMITFFKNPYFLMTTIGITNVILLLIYELFTYYLFPDYSGIFHGFGNMIHDAGDFFLFLLDLFVEGIWNLGIWLTVYYLTPCHYFISEYISEYSYFMITALEEKSGFYRVENIAIFSVCYFFNFILCLVFNEVIILNFWNLDYNTRKRISERVTIETIETNDAQNMMELSVDTDNEDKDRDSS